MCQILAFIYVTQTSVDFGDFGHCQAHELIKKIICKKYTGNDVNTIIGSAHTNCPCEKENK